MTGQGMISALGALLLQSTLIYITRIGRSRLAFDPPEVECKSLIQSHRQNNGLSHV